MREHVNTYSQKGGPMKRSQIVGRLGSKRFYMSLKEGVVAFRLGKAYFGFSLKKPE